MRIEQDVDTLRTAAERPYSRLTLPKLPTPSVLCNVYCPILTGCLCEDDDFVVGGFGCAWELPAAA